MRFHRLSILVALVLAIPAFGEAPPAPRDVTITAPDGTRLAATHYPASKPGPAVLLLHMCNATRKSWEPLGPQLAAAGIHALALDFRGFGDSGGDRAQSLPPQQGQRLINEKWPGDVDAAYAFLRSQTGVDPKRIGAAGGSCGVNQAIHFARRNPDVRSLVLLAGPANPAALNFVETNRWLPLFAAAADDDQYDLNVPSLMQWMLALSGNPRNRFSGFKDGKHGTEIFGPHPELPRQIVDWYLDTLVKNPADRSVAVTPKKTPMLEFWQAANAADGVEKAVTVFRQARKTDPGLMVIPEGALNVIAYQHMQAGRTKQAIELFKLNTEAYASSANTWDSLGDAYLADGQKELAVKASLKAIEMLDADKANEEFKKAIRASAEEKIAKVKAAEKQ